MNNNINNNLKKEDIEKLAVKLYCDELNFDLKNENDIDVDEQQLYISDIIYELQMLIDLDCTKVINILSKLYKYK